MKLTPYLHLAWKEYRAVREFWLALLLFVVLGQWFVVSLSEGQGGPNYLVYNLALIAPVLFALGCAGAAFAMEKEEGTYDFLRASPISARQVLLSKLSVAVVATLAMFLALWLLALAFTDAKVPEALDGILGLWVPAAFEVIVWGTLFSLLTARPLLSICLAIVAGSTVAHLLAWSVMEGPPYRIDMDLYLRAIPWRLLVVLVVLIADVYLGLRWLHPGVRTDETALPTIDRRRLKELARGGRAITGEERLLVKPDLAAVLSHLLWQHWRQSAWLMLLMPVLCVALATLVRLSGISHPERYVIAPLAGLSALMGCCVFLPDQERRRFRFFVEHNVPPRSVWLTRQLPWILALVLPTLLICLVWVGVKQPLPIGGRFEHLPNELPPLALVLGFVMVSYTAGQWTSMMIRSGIVAGFCGLLLSCVLCGWLALMYTMQISWLWSVAPLPLVLLWATWLRAPDWVRENTRWSARFRAAAAVLIPAAVLLIAVPIYRVRQIPAVNPGFDPAQYLSEITLEATAAGELYRQADALYAQGPDNLSVEPWKRLPEGSGMLGGDVNASGSRAWTHLAEVSRAPTKDQLRWLKENAKPLALVLEASRQPISLPGDPRTVSDLSPMRNRFGLISLILASGRQLETQGKLDEALERYLAAVRVVSHWVSHLPGDDSGFQRTFDEINLWAAQKGQTPERIRAAIAKVQAIDASALRMEDGLKFRYIVTRRYVFGDLGARSALYSDQRYEGAMMNALWTTLMPWEKDRALRMLNLFTDKALARFREMHQTLAASGGIDSPDYFETTNYGTATPQSVQQANWLATTIPNLSGIGRWGIEAAREFAFFQVWRDTTLRLLAAEADRLERGEPMTDPQSNE